MKNLSDLLLFRTWWQYDALRMSIQSEIYHWFNIVEGCVWVAIGIAVLCRFHRHRHSLLEVYYALALITFGLTDFREAFVMQSWLVWVKGFVLAVLIFLRRIILRRYYPDRKAF